MIVKIVLLFLVFVGVMGMFGKLKMPRLPGQKHLDARKCPRCGCYRIGKGPCDCDKIKGKG